MSLFCLWNCFLSSTDNRRLVSLVGKAPDDRAGGLGSIPSQTNTQDFTPLQICNKIRTERKRLGTRKASKK